MIRKHLLSIPLALLVFSACFAATSNLKIIEDVPSTFVYPADGFLPFNMHRATQTVIALMLPGATFDDPRGVACVLLKSDHNPNQPLDDVVVTVIGVNSGAGELVYNVGLKDIRLFGMTGHGDKQFMAPTGVAIDADGDVAVADTGNNRIALLHHDGLRLKWVKAAGKKGSRLGQFSSPMGVAYDSEDNLYIADTGNNRIQVMDKNGHFRLLSTPLLEAPSAIAATDGRQSWTFYQQGPYANRLAIIDRQGQHLQTLTLEGELLGQTRADQIPDPPVKLWGCAFDYYGNVVATDFAKSCLRKFDKDLRYIVTFGGEGDDDFQFLEPRGIAIHPQFGQVIVAEKKSAQYFWNGADAVSLKAEQDGPKVRIPFFLTERAFVTAQIVNAQGEAVKNLASGQDLEEGPQELDWAPDASVNGGQYSLKMRLMATYSSRDRIAKDITLPVNYVK